VELTNVVQYVFTPRFTCDFKEAPPLVEVLPPLVPLAGALSARQWEEHQAALAAAAAEAKAVEDAKAAEEAAVRFPLSPPPSEPVHLSLNHCQRSSPRA
jgi:hypothetical protein